MTYRIQTKRSNEANLKPHFTELLPGELALNYSDMILYALDSGGNVRQITSGGGGGDLVAMKYTFWVKVVQDGESLTRFEGTDDNGADFDVNIEGFDVALNGVSLKPGTDYTIDEFALILDEPATVGDVVIVRSLEPTDGVASTQLTTNDIALLGDDTQTPVSQAYKEWTERNNLQTQQDANWHLQHTIENLEIPEEFNPEGLATSEYVDQQDQAVRDIAYKYTDQEIDMLEQRVGVGYSDAISDVVDAQKLVDEGQDREIEQIEARVSQIESVSLDAKYLYESDNQIPRDGEFTCLKSNGTEITNEWADTQMLYFAENAVEGKPDWNHVTENDVIRIGGSSVGIILPTQQQVREADTFAEFKVVGLPGDRLFEVEPIRSSGQPMAGVEYGVLLLSSFDPSGLATTDYVTAELAKKYDKSGGEITGNVNVTGGTLKITKNELKIEKEDGSNAFRVQPETQVTFNVPSRMNDTLDMKDNKIIGCGPADPERGHDVVNVDFLNEALGTIETNVGDAVLSDNQTFTGINTFTKEIRSESNTVMEFKGDPSNPQDRHFKVRRGIVMTIYCYAGQDNNSAKKCFHAKWDRDQPNPEVFMNYVADPTNNGNPVNLRYANNTYLKKEDYADPTPPKLKPITFKCDQYAKGSQATTPGEGEVCGVYNTAPGSSTSGNPYWGNINVELRVHPNKLRDENGAEIPKGYNKVMAGYVTLVGKDNKTYLKAAISSVSRPSGQDYIAVHFANRTKVFGTGSYDSSANGYAVLIEGYEYDG